MRPLYIDAVFDAKILVDREEFMERVLARVREVLRRLGARRARVWRG